jgi:hypothetical protein
MFMIVGFPWTVPSAHVELTGINRPAARPRETPLTAAQADQDRKILTSSKA